MYTTHQCLLKIICSLIVGKVKIEIKHDKFADIATYGIWGMCVTIRQDVTTLWAAAFTKGLVKFHGV